MTGHGKKEKALQIDKPGRVVEEDGNSHPPQQRQAGTQEQQRQDPGTRVIDEVTTTDPPTTEAWRKAKEDRVALGKADPKEKGETQQIAYVIGVERKAIIAEIAPPHNR